MRHFSVTPPLTIKGREFHGLRGYAGKPFHPPLTDVPVAAYLFGALFDVLSALVHAGHPALAIGAVSRGDVGVPGWSGGVGTSRTDRVWRTGTGPVSRARRCGAPSTLMPC